MTYGNTLGRLHNRYTTQIVTKLIMSIYLLDNAIEDSTHSYCTRHRDPIGMRNMGVSFINSPCTI